MSMSSPPGRRARQRQRDPARIRAAVVLLVLIVVAGAIVGWAFGHDPYGNNTSAGASPTPQPCPTATSKTLMLPNKSVQLNVLNGTNRSGLAAMVAKALRQRGFQVPFVGNSTAGFGGAAQVRYGSKGLAAARTTYLQVPGATLTRINRPSARVDVVLGSKYGRLSTATQISAATKKMRAAPIC